MIKKVHYPRFYQKIHLFRPLVSRPFTLLWIGQSISLLGDNIFTIALAWEVILLTGSSVAMGLVVVAQLIPTILFVLLGGVFADRLPRRLIMLCSDVGRGLIVLFIAANAYFHFLQFWQLILLALLFGIADSFFTPAYRSFIPQLVERENLSSANALTALSKQISQSAGPAVGAFCLSLGGVAFAFGLDGLSFIVSAACLFALGIPLVLRKKQDRQTSVAPEESSSRKQPSGQGIGTRMKEGLHYVKSVPWIWMTILLAAIANVGYAGPIMVVLPKLVRSFYHAGPWLLGILGTMGALGAITGTLIIGQFKHIRHKGVLAYTAMIASSLALIGFGLPFPVSFRSYAACFASFLAGCSLSTFQIIWVTLIQTHVPPEKLGRISSVDILGSYSLLPVGLLLAGFLADRIGPAWVFLGGGVLILPIALVGLCLPSIRSL